MRRVFSLPQCKTNNWNNKYRIPNICKRFNILLSNNSFWCSQSSCLSTAEICSTYLTYTCYNPRETLIEESEMRKGTRTEKSLGKGHLKLHFTEHLLSLCYQLCLKFLFTATVFPVFMHGINFHSYADDTQHYIGVSPDDTSPIDAPKDIDWMIPPTQLVQNWRNHWSRSRALQCDFICISYCFSTAFSFNFFYCLYLFQPYFHVT